MENMLTKMDKRFSINIDGGLSGFTPPAHDLRTMFRDRLNENKLFAVNTEQEVREDFKIFTAGLKFDCKNVKKITFENFYDTLEDLARRIWGRGGCTVLLYTFYILCKKGAVFKNVRYYAVEFLKTFWQVILPDKKRKYLDKFIKNYLIAASGFFKKWILLSEYLKE